MKALAVIPAAGRGVRFGAATAKQFLPLHNKPILIWTLEAFERASLIEAVCVTAPEPELEAVRELVATYSLKKVKWIVAGGKERQDSVANGFRALPDAGVVVVHDGVRPFVSPELIDQTIQVAYQSGACIAALPVAETIKRVTADKVVEKTVDRSALWSVQTPQTFRAEIYRKALAQAEQEKFYGTDEAMLIERIGVPVHVVPGDVFNIKITTPDDLPLAEKLWELIQKK